MTNEVRVGNWVFADGVKVRVTPIMIALSEGLGEFCLKLTPIPLTPEILEKAGFVKANSNVPNLCRLPFDKYKQLRWSDWDGVCIETMKSGWIWQLENIKYLHQLQNLYFALTGKELQIEL